MSGIAARASWKTVILWPQRQKATLIYNWINIQFFIEKFILRESTIGAHLKRAKSNIK